MSTTSIPQASKIDNLIASLPASTQQAIADAKAIEPQVNGRYAGAIDRIIRNTATVNSDGTVDVLSRTGGHVHHIGNGSPCDCQDARFHAPVIAGKRACVHQVVAWILLKAQRLAQAERTARDSAPVQTPTQTKWADRQNRSCWHCGSTSFTDEALRGKAGRCHYCGSLLTNGDDQAKPAGSDTQDQPAPTPTQAQATPTTFSQAQLIAAASKLHGVTYAVEPAYIGGHGYVQILQAKYDPQVHEMYLIAGDWKADALYVALWGDQWGEIDKPAMQRLAAHVPAPGPEPEPRLAYYLETAQSGIKVMVTTGKRHSLPGIVRFIPNGPDRLEKAAQVAQERAALQVAAIRRVNPSSPAEVRHGFMPPSWRNRTGGDQIGKAWVVYA